jgi:triacylglycerol lipase
MRKIETALARAGFEVCNVDYPSRTASIAVLAETAISGALSSSQLRSCTRIHFVTHSLGGILVRSYFKSHSPERVGRVVMLGPPNGGSEVVDRLRDWCFFRWLNGPAGSELGTAADSTPNQLGPVHFELGVIAGDRSINWINSLWIKGPNDGKVSVERTRVPGLKELLIVHVTHPFLMRRREVIEPTLRFLKMGCFGSNSTSRGKGEAAHL